MKTYLIVLSFALISIQSFAIDNNELEACISKKIDSELKKRLDVSYISIEHEVFESSLLDRTSTSGKTIVDRDYGIDFRISGKRELVGKAWLTVTNVSKDGLSLGQLRCKFALNFRNSDGRRPCNSHRNGLELSNEELGYKIVRSINPWPPQQCGPEF